MSLHTIVALKNSASAHLLLRTTKTLISPSPLHPHTSRNPHRKVIFSTIQLHPITKVNAFSHETPQTFDPQLGTRSFEPRPRSFNLDGFLSVLELASLASSAAVVAYAAVNSNSFGNGALVGVAWAMLVGCAVIGSVIRRRQWVRVRGSDSSGGSGAYLTRRVEKLEEEFRGSVTVIRVLSRQIEKLGTRVRAYRKSLTQPVAETAALAQKNSEATRALAAQEDVLEKELGEVQKVLLAMQEQQQKQLELILAIGKAGRLWENKPSRDQDSHEEACNNNSPDGVRIFETDNISK